MSVKLESVGSVEDENVGLLVPEVSVAKGSSDQLLSDRSLKAPEPVKLSLGRALHRKLPPGKEEASMEGETEESIGEGRDSPLASEEGTGDEASEKAAGDLHVVAEDLARWDETLDCPALELARAARALHFWNFCSLGLRLLPPEVWKWKMGSAMPPVCPRQATAGGKGEAMSPEPGRTNHPNFLHIVTSKRTR